MSERRRNLEILLTADDIARRVEELGKAISHAYGATPIALLAILKGSLLFAADLLRQLPESTTFDHLQVASYRGGTRPSGPPELVPGGGLDRLAGRHVLLVDDIVDTGATLARVHEAVAAVAPAGLRKCVLLDKPSRRHVEVEVDWVGFTIPDRFVVGYGLDSDEKLRGLPHIAVVGDGG